MFHETKQVLKNEEKKKKKRKEKKRKVQMLVNVHGVSCMLCSRLTASRASAEYRYAVLPQPHNYHLAITVVSHSQIWIGAPTFFTLPV